MRRRYSSDCHFVTILVEISKIFGSIGGGGSHPHVTLLATPLGMDNVLLQVLANVTKVKVPHLYEVCH